MTRLLAPIRYYVATILAIGGFYAAVHYLLQGRLWLLGAGLVGILTSFLFVWITQYYTESRYRPVQEISKASVTGPATNIISGLAVGFETPAIPVLVIGGALLTSYFCGVTSKSPRTRSRTIFRRSRSETGASGSMQATFYIKMPNS